STTAGSVGWFVLVGLGLAFALNAFSVAMVRVWNPSRELRTGAAPQVGATEDQPLAAALAKPTEAVVVGKARGQDAVVHKAGGKSREVWNNPILWREVRTWAYGKKVLAVKGAYLLIYVVCALAVVRAVNEPSAGRSAIPAAATPMAPLLVVSLVLINALSVTSLTGERDGKSLDLLL
ncbi:unnamed protein product, partial [Ectocarpus sp. 4 AP-2014]